MLRNTIARVCYGPLKLRGVNTIKLAHSWPCSVLFSPQNVAPACSLSNSLTSPNNSLTQGQRDSTFC